MSLMYPADGIDGYPREAFIEDLVAEAASEIRACLDRGAIVQIDFTEARLSLKLDPSGGLLDAFVDLNNRVLDGLTDAERQRVGRAHLPGRRPGLDPQRGHRLRGAAARPVPPERRTTSTSSSPARRIASASSGSSATRRRATGGSSSASSTRSTRASRRPEEVRDRVLEAARFIDPSHLGTTDDCGFSPFGDDTSTSRDTAFAKIQARITGTAMASEELGV